MTIDWYCWDLNLSFQLFQKKEKNDSLLCPQALTRKWVKYVYSKYSKNLLTKYSVPLVCLCHLSLFWKYNDYLKTLTLVRKWESETRNERKPIKSVFMSKLWLWATEAQSYLVPLEDWIELCCLIMWPLATCGWLLS